MPFRSSAWTRRTGALDVAAKSSDGGTSNKDLERQQIGKAERDGVHMVMRDGGGVNARKLGRAEPRKGSTAVATERPRRHRVARCLDPPAAHF